MNFDIPSETRRKYILVGSTPTSMLVTVSEKMPKFLLQILLGSRNERQKNPRRYV